MKKTIKYGLGILTILMVIFFSFDKKKLDEYMAAEPMKNFDAVDYALDVWEKKMPLALKDAPEIQSLTEMLKTKPEQAFEQFGRKLGISKTWYFLTKGKGTVEAVGEEFLLVKIDEQFELQVATGFIFGNAVRDGSGVVNIDEFVNMTDFNNVSIAINNFVKEEVVPTLKNAAKRGMKIEFAGAFEIKESDININSIRIIPVSAKLTNGE
jgi:predicted lipoprotein